MAYPNVIYGPISEAFNTYDPVSPAPGSFTDGTLAQRGRHRLGTQLVTPDQKKFRFALNGAAALVVGEVQSSAAIISTDVDLTPSAGAVGARSVSVTHGAATTAVNYFAEGFAVMSLAPGAGHAYQIASHEALGSGTAHTIYFSAGHALREAITATTDVDLIANPYASIIQCAATISGAPIGVAVTALAIGDFGWEQTRGVCGVLCTGTVTIGSPVVMLLSGGTAGTPAPASAATQPEVGTVLRVAATAEWSSIFLTIDG